jgi:hypothetical protein
VSLRLNQAHTGAKISSAPPWVRGWEPTSGLAFTTGSRGLAHPPSCCGVPAASVNRPTTSRRYRVVPRSCVSGPYSYICHQLAAGRKNRTHRPTIVSQDDSDDDGALHATVAYPTGCPLIHSRVNVSAATNRTDWTSLQPREPQRRTLRTASTVTLGVSQNSDDGVADDAVLQDHRSTMSRQRPP